MHGIWHSEIRATNVSVSKKNTGGFQAKDFDLEVEDEDYDI